MTSAETGQDIFRGQPQARRPRTTRVLASIALGGGLGSLARHLVGVAIPAPSGTFPWATFLINVTGCFALGLLMVFVLEIWPPTRYVRPFAGIGFLGGYTTFSTVMVEILRLPAALAWSYALGGVLAGLLAVWAGMTLARLLPRIPVRRRVREEPR